MRTTDQTTTNQARPIPHGARAGARAPMRPGTKAETLERLRARYPQFNVPDLEYFNLKRWRAERPKIIAALQRRFADGLVVVRSSSQAEDTLGQSNAGAFLSVLDVDPLDSVALEEAVQAVADSLPGGPDDQVLVQPVVRDLVVSGVIMTRCMYDGSPYMVLNYDDESGRSDSVTGGVGETKTIHVFRGVLESDLRSERVRAMVRLARELEAVFGSSTLDIEFGLDRSGVMHLFQVRPMASVREWSPEVDERIASRISFVESFVTRSMRSHPGVYGEKSVLGVMPDWNPAEMIGVMPRPLASSLYRELITREEWRLAREEMGYHQMPAEELMVLVAGRPYIDVRASFNSFLPRGVAPNLAATLVDAWLERLREHPELHDKVEFNVAFTCLDFTFDRRFKELYPGLLPAKDLGVYKGLLMGLTRNCLDLSPSGSLSASEARVSSLYARQAMRCAPDTAGNGLLPKIKTLAEECRLLGTRPFSILARHAFIAETILRSAVDLGAIDGGRVALLRRSITTISGDITADFRRVLAGEISKPAFLAKYGHLRPGSYDILSPCYAKRDDIFEAMAVEPPEPAGSEFALTADERRGIESLLSESGLSDISADGLVAYIRRAVAGREFGKFVFTRNLSDILEGLAAWGETHGLSRDDVSFLNFQDIMEQLTVSVLTPEPEHFRGMIERNRFLYSLGQTLRLPYVLVSPRDVYVAPQHRSTPNFISDKRVAAGIVHLSSQDTGVDLSGKIVCIENADPGFDWIFSRSIAGVVTKFGGANSHMAVRCAEYGLPAAIGCGEALFNDLKFSASAELDPVLHILRPLSERTPCASA